MYPYPWNPDSPGFWGRYQDDLFGGLDETASAPNADPMSTLQSFDDDVDHAQTSQCSPNTRGSKASAHAPATWQPHTDRVEPFYTKRGAQQAVNSPGSSPTRLNARAPPFVPQSTNIPQERNAYAGAAFERPPAQSRPVKSYAQPSTASVLGNSSQRMPHGTIPPAFLHSSQLRSSFRGSATLEPQQYPAFTSNSPYVANFELPLHDAQHPDIRFSPPNSTAQWHYPTTLPLTAQGLGVQAGPEVSFHASRPEPDVRRWMQGPYTILDRTNPSRLAPSRSISTSRRRRNLVSEDGSATTLSCEYPGCSQTFSSKSKLDHHVRWHGPKDKICLICGKGFVAIKDLKRHQTSHFPEENMFFCEVEGCPYSIKGFNRKDNWHRHRKLHLGSTSSSQSMSRTSSAYQ
ncbi:hypothetical protein Q7P37_005954 [Cladosporium fusiforme]